MTKINSMRKKCRKWDDFKNDRKLRNWIKSLQPKFGNFDQSPLEVEIIYLNSSSDPRLLIGLKELWEDFFLDLGISNINFEYETSTIQ